MYYLFCIIFSDEWKSRKSVQNPLDERALADLVLDNERMPSEPRDQREFARYRISEWPPADQPFKNQHFQPKLRAMSQASANFVLTRTNWSRRQSSL